MKLIKKETVSVKFMWLDWAVYAAMFFIILLPFLEIGILKVMSIALILGFFAGFLNRFLREWYIFKKTFTEDNETEKLIKGNS